MRFQSLSIFIYILMNIITIFTAIYLGQSKNTIELLKGQKIVEDKTANLSYLTKPIYYILKDDRAYLHLEANEITINSKTSNIVLFSPSGSLFNEKGEPLRFSGDRGLLKEKAGTLELIDDISLKFGQTHLYSNFAKYDFIKQRVHAKTNVRTKSISKKTLDTIFVNADVLTADIKKEVSHYKGHVKGKIIRKKVYENKVLFETDDLLVQMKLDKLTLTGNVLLKKPGLKARSKRGEVFLKNYNEKLKYYVLYDDVVVVEQVVVDKNFNGEVPALERRAFAEKLEGFMTENKIILSGYPKVLSDGDIIKGNLITLRGDTDVIEVDDANTEFKLR